MATMDEYLKLREIGKSEAEASDIISKDLPEEERKMRKEMDEIMRKRFYKDPYEGMSEEEIEFIKNQLKIREQQRKDMGLPEGIQLLNQGGLAKILGV